MVSVATAVGLMAYMYLNLAALRDKGRAQSCPCMAFQGLAAANQDYQPSRQLSAWRTTISLADYYQPGGGYYQPGGDYQPGRAADAGTPDG